MLIYAMSVSVDGFVNDRNGDFGWGPVSDELFAFHLARVRGLDSYLLGRRLHAAMLPWETDPAMRRTPLFAEFADVWTALPKVVFSRTLGRVDGNARLARGSVADEVAAVSGDAEIGGPGLAAQAVDSIDEFRVFRFPLVVGGGTPYLPPVTGNLDLALRETRTFDGRVVYERYGRSAASARGSNAQRPSDTTSTTSSTTVTAEASSST